ncbi:cardiotrophin-1-like isoform X2 [Hemicordylus capensis]|uniref:cardiotrophin-1-like isoform X2 n=1 Tax=Hemicordylus capensis TaxID=884348 RepID=UPI0023023587|nr:cardiotrophin-1-like isoform X2 [Hemicordylus capensis]
MEVLSVDFSKCRSSSSSSSRSQQDLAAKIDQTHKLTIHIQNSSESLLREYVALQGHPFEDPSFNYPITGFPGLPQPFPGSPNTWLKPGDPGRLQEDAMVFSNLPVFLATVKRQQAELNPSAKELQHHLENASLQCLGLASNLKSVMASLGIVPGPAVPPEPPEEDNGFYVKLVGCQICSLFKIWASRSREDLAHLAKKYPF